MRKINRRTFIKTGTLLGVGVAMTNTQCIPVWSSNQPLKDYLLHAVPLCDVDVIDTFWSPRIKNTRDVTLPYLLNRISGPNLEGRILEGASYFIAKEYDPVLHDRIKASFESISESMHTLMNDKWPNTGDGPFFRVGHFIEGAIAYKEATGDDLFLNLAREVADDLDQQYGYGKRTDISNHEEIELALVKLYRITGEERYARLAQFLVDVRGTTEGGRTMTGYYAQDAVPVKKQRRAIGHSVRATYLYCAVTDLAALYPQDYYHKTIQTIWQDATSKRTYLTGGVGSYRRMEDYGDDYDLPNAACWNEICASVGNALWNHRMSLLEGHGKYVDMMERILYNGVLAGVSIDGSTFLYQAPLKAWPEFRRQTSFGPNCCPPNIMRLMAELGTMIYSQKESDLYVNLFIGSNARFEVAGKTVSLRQETNYPWDLSSRITVGVSEQSEFDVKVRIPGWACGEFDSGNLYRYNTAPTGKYTLTINGQTESYQVKDGFAVLRRQWKDNDVIEVAFPSDVRLVKSDDRALENKGMTAITRGPLVFCVEGLDNHIDNANNAFSLIVPESSKLEYNFDSALLGGIGTIEGKVERLLREGEHRELKRRPTTLKAIPYYAFGNREATEMAVWLASDETRAETFPAVTLASTSLATSSCGHGSVAENYPGNNPPTVARRMYPWSQDGSGSISAISDGLTPVNSEDGSSTFLRLRPQSGSSAWVQYDFTGPTQVSSVSVYWKDDKQFCVLPASWTLLYRDGDQWKPVQSPSGYGIQKDMYNKTSFTPVYTDGLRMEIELDKRVYKTGELGQPDANYLTEDQIWYEGGIIEWTVEGDVPAPPTVFNSYLAEQDHALDPNPDSDFWRGVKGVILDRNILGDPDAVIRSEARSRWTKNNLYFLFQGPYQALNLKPDPVTTKETEKLWLFDDFELYLGCNFENINLYGEYQISPQGEYLDNDIDATVQRPGWGEEHRWNSGMKVKSIIDEEKKIWYGEMCIPLAAIDKRTPAEGNEFRANIYRLQTAGEGRKRHFLAWQPTGEWNPHKPLKFGTMKLVSQP
ncbi:DUF1680 family protein [Parabacteroides sp. PFB2-10]|uniref:beta-L-arabinofuranosidase domain-containing protein n=1 Tax=Parabacteroides sp. PFB2-10 TaxID=1742405 RepID=UPI0024756452|nr:beta-L-arabinofuranosidase domain-containing protein [Parabacteroides sp. PFB2-10]MDH6311671.1 DUF1680 family protein [Parabacteroides sp. PFB2-10]